MEQMVNGLKYDTDAAARVQGEHTGEFQPPELPADGVNSSNT